MGTSCQKRGPWTLPGAEFPNDEAVLWTDSVIRDGVDPVPRFEVKSLTPSDPTKRAVIVQFAPVGDPPCITTDGEVYVRASGQSVPVRDAGALERLFERGERARAAAQERAHKVYGLGTLMRSSANERQLALAIAPFEVAPDVRFRIFGSGRSDALRALLRERLRPSYPFGLRDGGEVMQHGYMVSIESDRFNEAAWLLVAENGAVCVGLSREEVQGAHRVIDEGWFAGAWQAAALAAQAIGGHGPAYLYAAMPERNGDVGIERWLEDLEPSDALLDGVEREVRRAQGHPAVEPGPS